MKGLLGMGRYDGRNELGRFSMVREENVLLQI